MTAGKTVPAVFFRFHFQCSASPCDRKKLYLRLWPEIQLRYMVSAFRRLLYIVYVIVLSGLRLRLFTVRISQDAVADALIVALYPEV